MNAMDLHPLPTTGAVLKEQTLTVGLALRPMGIGVGLFLLITGLLVVTGGLGPPRALPVRLSDANLVFLSLIGIAFPLFTRRGGVTPFRSGLPWALPVERSRHILLREAAGWIWLMVAVGAVLFWMAGVPFLAGGRLPEPTTYLVGPVMGPRPLDPASLPTMLWSTPWWLWLVPFAGAAALFLLASALFLATPHPGRWMVGTILGLFFIALLTERAQIPWLVTLGDYTLEPLFNGRYGFITLTTGATTAVEGVDLPTGESLPMFFGVPSVGRWLVAAGLWNAAGLLALGLSALRHRDGAGGGERG